MVEHPPSRPGDIYRQPAAIHNCPTDRLRGLFGTLPDTWQSSRSAGSGALYRILGRSQPDLRARSNAGLVAAGDSNFPTPVRRCCSHPFFQHYDDPGICRQHLAFQCPGRRRTRLVAANQIPGVPGLDQHFPDGLPVSQRALDPPLDQMARFIVVVGADTSHIYARLWLLPGLQHLAHVVGWIVLHFLRAQPPNCPGLPLSAYLNLS